MDRNALEISKRLKFPQNDRTDKNIIAQPKTLKALQID